jgi:oligopeptide transport system substrate-binding protein
VADAGRGPSRRALLAAAGGLWLAACGRRDPGAPVAAPAAPVGGASGQELAARQVLRRGNGVEPETLDPHRAEGVSTSNILRDLFEGLVTEAPDGSLEPGAAARWATSADGRTWTFTLRPDGRWSNGDPVTAFDFEYGLRRSVDPATLSEYAAILAPLANAEAVIAGAQPPTALGVRALDATTLELRLNAPTPYLLGLLTHSSAYPVYRPSVEQHGPGFARPGRLVGNGAYVLAEWAVQSHVRLARNRRFRDDRATTVDEVWYYPIESADAELNRYRAGELDVTYTVPLRQLAFLRANLADELRIAPYLGSYVFGFNVTQPPFRDNPGLRRALVLALDRDILTGRITGAGEIAASTWVPPMPGYASPVPDWAGWSQADREAEARRLYAAAGYSRERPLRVQLLYNTDTNHRRLCAAMAAMWREVLGVEAELQNQEWQVFLQTRRERLDTQVFRYGWIGDYQDPYTFLEILHSRHGLNDMGYANPAYDALLAAAGAEADAARRLALLSDAERVLLDDLPLIPLYYYVSKQLVKPWVAGLVPNLLDHHYSRHLRILAH